MGGRQWGRDRHAAEQPFPTPAAAGTVPEPTAVFPNATSPAEGAVARELSEVAEDIARSPRVQVLHEDARIFLYHNFLTPEECEHIKSLAEPQLHRSG